MSKQTKIFYFANFSAAIAIFGAGAVLFFALLNTHQDVNYSKSFARETRERAVAIQKSREQAVFVQCKEQNLRHDRTLAKLDDIIAGLPPGPEKVRAKTNRKGTVALIEALAPKRDCLQRVRQLVTSTPR